MRGDGVQDTRLIPNCFTSRSDSFSSLNYERRLYFFSLFDLVAFCSHTRFLPLILSLSLFIFLCDRAYICCGNVTFCLFIVWLCIVWHCFHPCLTCISFSYSCCVFVYDMALCPHYTKLKRCVLIMLWSQWVFFCSLTLLKLFLVALLWFRFLLEADCFVRKFCTVLLTIHVFACDT